MSLQDLPSKNHKQKQKKVSVTQIKDKKQYNKNSPSRNSWIQSLQKTLTWRGTLKYGPVSLPASLRLHQESVVRCLCVVGTLAPGSDPHYGQVP